MTVQQIETVPSPLCWPPHLLPRMNEVGHIRRQRIANATSRTPRSRKLKHTQMMSDRWMKSRCIQNIETDENLHILRLNSINWWNHQNQTQKSRIRIEITQISKLNQMTSDWKMDYAVQSITPKLIENYIFWDQMTPINKIDDVKGENI